jgi:hypothetical protein
LIIKINILEKGSSAKLGRDKLETFPSDKLRRELLKLNDIRSNDPINYNQILAPNFDHFLDPILTSIFMVNFSSKNVIFGPHFG